MRRRPAAAAILLLGLAVFPTAAAPGAPPATPGPGTDSRLVVTFKAGPVKEPRAGRFRILRIETGKRGGSAAALVGMGGDRSQGTGKLSDAFSALSALAATWSAAHPPSRLELRRHRDHLEVQATGPNPLGALTAFVSTLDLQLDAWGALSAFLGIAIGTETNGASLGVAAHDPDTGASLTATLLSCHEVAGSPQAILELRLPPYLAPARLDPPLRERTAAFAHRSGVPIEMTHRP